jgi:hypothetical protein
MTNIARMAVVCLLAAIVLLAVPIAEAQTTPDPPAAPVPVQILAAKKIFIANGDSAPVFGVPSLAYNEFYASVKNSNQYELVQAPADADLVLEVRYEIVFPGATELQLRLAVIDPKTSVVLWRITEHVQPWGRDATGRKNFSKAIATLLSDLQNLRSSSAATTGPPAPNN